MTIDRRKHARFTTKHTVRCTSRAAAAGPADRSTAVTKNISGGGLLMETSRYYKLGEFLQLEISLPNWEKYKEEFFKNFYDAPAAAWTESSYPFSATGKVVFVKSTGGGKYEVGIQFSGIDEGNRLALIKYLRDRT